MLNITQKNVKPDIERFKLYSLDTLSTPKTGKVLANWLLGIFLILFFCLFLPWQQNITGKGKVTALDPKDRPQTIQSAIAGRITDWRVQEGQYVQAGDTILVLAEVKDDYFDPQILVRLQEQITAKNQSIEATQNQISATERQLVAINQGLGLSLQKARNKVKQNRLKVTSDSIDLVNERVQYDLAGKQFARFEELYKKKGLISLTDLEKRRQYLQEKQAKAISTENKLLVSRQELINSLIELNSINAEYTDKISKTEAELGAKKSYLADAESELSKQRNKYKNVEIRRDNYFIIAPQDGYIVRALKAGIGETIKESDPVVTIQPDMPSTAVELYVRAMDVPLLTKGRKVRLEFDGWPALQFSGWPSVTVGTFGGVIQVIDYVNSPDGTYRILVVPDPADDPWPAQVRLGSGVYGWAMLDDVAVWYEIWRQLNGFPPSLKEAPEGSKTEEKGIKK
jgi:adhesin transport system membrane fusion protein